MEEAARWGTEITAARFAGGCGTAERDQALEASLARIGMEPPLVDSAWTLYTLAPAEVEFWQAARSRVHTRLRYERSGSDWQRFRLWSWRPRAPHRPAPPMRVRGSIPSPVPAHEARKAP